MLFVCFVNWLSVGSLRLVMLVCVVVGLITLGLVFIVLVDYCLLFYYGVHVFLALIVRFLYIVHIWFMYYYVFGLTLLTLCWTCYCGGLDNFGGLN